LYFPLVMVPQRIGNIDTLQGLKIVGHSHRSKMPPPIDVIEV